MSGLEDLLDGFDSPETRRALELANEDQRFIVQLIQMRKDAGMSQQQVADAIGVTQATVSAFERLGNDPHLSTVRRYAWAVGATVHHIATPARAEAASLSASVLSIASRHPLPFRPLDNQLEDRETYFRQVARGEAKVSS